MPVQCGLKQAQPIHEQFRRKAGHRVPISDLIWLIPIWTSAKRHPPEMAKVGFVLLPIIYDLEWLCERRVFLHTIIEVADDRLDLIESYISGNIVHHGYA
jgi:hypothetical protein